MRPPSILVLFSLSILLLREHSAWAKRSSKGSTTSGWAFGKGGGSPFSQFPVQGMGNSPNVKSKGFAKKAALAVGVGVAKRVAVDYGLGRFPRPNFSFRSPQEEYYYNRYMYQRYGLRSTDENDFSHDYRYTQPGQSYDRYMESCLKRTDLLRGQEGGDGAGLQGEDPSAVANGSEAGASALLLGNGTVNATSDLETMNGTERNSTPPPEIHKALPS
ncbi:hypothetical protein SKAU_G00411640 [Synaphobranchus kaupii]|uniref:Uncharacterized protein n=1 Tax=Synaphobranchus kaupii TaxID=118154 RepID=A0A9Q1E7V6_SYNKA|nr:hypothetical protein SKAU_G00411640 [Synaphobranchus kaupii]